jgi:hypothetical protein
MPKSIPNQRLVPIAQTVSPPTPTVPGLPSEGFWPYVTPQHPFNKALTPVPHGTPLVSPAYPTQTQIQHGPNLSPLWA